MVYSIDTIKAKLIPLSITQAAIGKAPGFFNTFAVYVVDGYSITVDASPCCENSA
ncbi:MAG: hypothetical protein CLLPBCKN_007090 [Chroococcidiopsis cubana SAG 39.79]|uniref:Uncharacterized protein n=1 Tax=Chroococcidiopsis cubana SAG 39.79 TaxID=388085 RepID=A0AB37UDI4_9CYAN|nr:hypothetical protein [Chroococcidiopsis cubana]MDZ4877655.1 hypothetical protein [Chroococcidiopsis cubana SAG 39.79]RUT04554.1 hypothetical protein DSM107010_57340 [Chroococcidiopsis cubana SAG 39.79]